MTTSQPIRVALLGHSSRSDNLGVGALTVSQIEILRGIAKQLGREIEISIIEWKDKRKPYINGPDIRIVEMNGRFILSPTGFWREVRRADLVIDIGAGDSFTDIYGGKRLRWMFIMKFLTHIARRPLVMAPQTIGPFSKPFSKFLARLSMKLCAVVASRDRLSTQAAHDMGVSENVIEASDVALLLPYDKPLARQKDGKIRVGLNVSGLLMAGGYTGKNEFGLSLDYPALIKDIIRFFEAEGAEVHLVSHVLHEGGKSPTFKRETEDDYGAACELALMFPGVVVGPPFGSPSEAKSYISTLDFFLGARMHACIAAFSSGVPVIPMAYSRKFRGLFGSIGYDRTVDCTSDSAAVIKERVLSAWTERDLVAHEVNLAQTKGSKKLDLYAEQLSSLISAIPRKSR